MSSILKALEKKTKARRPRVEDGFYHPTDVPDKRGDSRPVYLLGGLSAILLAAVALLIGMQFHRPPAPGDLPEASLAAPSSEGYGTENGPLESPKKEDEKLDAVAAELAEMKTLIREFGERSADPGGQPSAAWPVIAIPVAPGQGYTMFPANPGTEPPAPAVSVMATATPAKQRTPTFRLTATATIRGRNVALVDGTFYGAGEKVEGWVIAEVGQSYIKVEGWPEKIWIKR